MRFPPVWQDRLSNMLTVAKAKQQNLRLKLFLPNTCCIPIMSSKTDEILESLKTLSLLEASELVKQIEEAFGVSAAASAGVVMAAPGAAGGGEAPAEEKTEFDVVLESFDASAKIKVLKEVRNATGLGLGDAKAMVEAAPKTIKEGIAKEEAEALKKAIEDVGGKVTLK